MVSTVTGLLIREAYWPKSPIHSVLAVHVQPVACQVDTTRSKTSSALESNVSSDAFDGRLDQRLNSTGRCQPQSQRSWKSQQMAASYRWAPQTNPGSLQATLRSARLISDRCIPSRLLLHGPACLVCPHCRGCRSPRLARPGTAPLDPGHCTPAESAKGCTERWPVVSIEPAEIPPVTVVPDHGPCDIHPHPPEDARCPRSLSPVKAGQVKRCLQSERGRV